MMIPSLDAKKASTILIRRMCSLRSNGAKRRSYETKSRGSTQMVEINHLRREISRVVTVQIFDAESDTNLL